MRRGQVSRGCVEVGCAHPPRGRAPPLCSPMSKCDAIVPQLCQRCDGKISWGDAHTKRLRDTIVIRMSKETAIRASLIAFARYAGPWSATPGARHCSFFAHGGRGECRYGWESTDSAGSAGTRSAPPRRRPRQAGGEDANAIEWVAVNDLTDAKTLAHLLKYDSILGPYPGRGRGSRGRDRGRRARAEGARRARSRRAAVGRARGRRGDRVDRPVHRPRQRRQAPRAAARRRWSSPRRRAIPTRRSCSA